MRSRYISPNIGIFERAVHLVSRSISVSKSTRYETITPVFEASRTHLGHDPSFSGRTLTYSDQRLCAVLGNRLTSENIVIEAGSVRHRLAHINRNVVGRAA